MHKCGDSAECQGTAGARELAALPEAASTIRQQVLVYDWPNSQVGNYLKALRADGDPAVCLFRCLHAELISHAQTSSEAAEATAPGSRPQSQVVVQ